MKSKRCDCGCECAEEPRKKKSNANKYVFWGALTLVSAACIIYVAQKSLDVNLNNMFDDELFL
jgi:hypothetical protein